MEKEITQMHGIQHLKFTKSRFRLVFAFLLFVLVGTVQKTFSQITLNPGDVALLGINASTTDRFSWTITKPIASGTILYFTDNGFSSTTTGRTGEGFLRFTAAIDYPAGRIFTWVNGGTVSSEYATLSGGSANAPTSMAFNASGDQFFIYQSSTALTSATAPTTWSSSNLTGLSVLYGINYGAATITTGGGAAGTTYTPATGILSSANFINFPSTSVNNLYYSPTALNVTAVSFAGTANSFYSSLSNTSNFFTSSSETTFPARYIFAIGTLSAVNTTYGSGSATPTSFQVTGTGLSANIALAALTGFQYATTVGGSYSNTLSLTQSSGAVNNTVFVRLAPTATFAGSPYSGSIGLSSTGAISVTMATVSSSVSKLIITSSDAIADNKIYDGSTTATISGATAVGTVNGDTISITGGGTFASANVADGISVTPSLTLNGTNATSYTLTQPTLSANITAKSLTISGLTANNKPYDGTTNATVSGTATLSGVIDGDETNVTLNGTPSAVFTSTAVGNTIPVNVTGYDISGTSSTNYLLVQPTILFANITATTPAAPSITNITAGDSQLTIAFTAGDNGGSPITDYKYSTNGGTSFTSAGTISSPIVISGLTNGSTYDVQLLALNAIGDGAASATVQGTPVAPTTPTITVNKITLDALSSTYGTVSVTDEFTVSGAALTSDITINSPSGFEISTTSSTSGFATSQVLSPSVGVVATTTIYVRLSDTTLAGTYSGNITLTSNGATTVTVATASSIVLPKVLTVTGLSGLDKTYDTTTTASVSGTATLNGIVGMDDVTLNSTSVTYNFDTATAGINKSITVVGFSLDGTSASNYSVSQPTSLTATIFKAASTITVTGSTSYTYNASEQGPSSSSVTGSTGAVTYLYTGVNPVVAPSDSKPFNAGSYTVAATVAADTNYETATSNDYAFTIDKANQTITLAETDTQITTTTSYTLTQNASSGLAITYSTNDTNVITIDNNTVTIVGPGLVTISANQSGNVNYNPAPQKTQLLTVSLPPCETVTGSTSWNFTAGASPSSTQANVTVSAINRVNDNGTISPPLIDTTSTSTGYTGVSGGNNAGASSVPGAFNESTSTYFTFQVTATTNFQLTAFSFGSRSTGTGPTAYVLRSSLDNFSANISNSSGTLTANSTWAFKSNSGIAVNGIANTPITFRLYVSGGSGSSGNNANFRMDDVTLSISTSNEPSQATVGSNQTICGLTSTSLGGNTPHTGTGTWLQVSGPGTTTFSAINSGSSTATASIVGTYVYRWTISNGCATTYAADVQVVFSDLTTSTSTISACGTYTWTAGNGNTYTESGTFTNVNGCHTETLALTIVTATTNTTSISACDTYTWTAGNGNTYTENGSYDYIVDCHTETLLLTIYPTITSSDVTISACDTYTWTFNGETYTASGDYTSTVNCNTTTLHLTITPSTTNTTTISACDTFTWTTGNGITYTESGNYTFVSGCHTETLALTITPSTSNTTTIVACDTYTWSAGNGNTYTTSGNYTYVTGCHTETLALTITPSTSNTTTVSACDTYTWSSGNGNTYTTSGNYTFVSGCHTEILALTINTNTIVSQPSDALICPLIGSTATFSVVPGSSTANYQWYSQIPTEDSITGVWSLVSNGGSYSGATSATLMVTKSLPIIVESGTKYRVVVTSDCGTITSNSAVLNDMILPVPANLILTNEAAVLPATPSTPIFVVSTYVGTETELKLTAAAVSDTTVSYKWILPVGVTSTSTNTETGLTITTANAINVKFTASSATTPLIIYVQTINSFGCSSALRPSPAFTRVLPLAPALSLNNGLNANPISTFGPYMGTNTVLRLSASVTSATSSYEWELPAGVNRVTELVGGTTTTSTFSIEPFIYVNFSGVSTLNTDSYVATTGVLTHVLRIGVKSKNGVGVSITNNSALINPTTTSTAKLITLTAVTPLPPATLVLNNGLNTAAVSVISKLIGQQGTYRLSATATTLASSYEWELPTGVTRVTALDGLTSINSTTSIDPFIYIKFTDNVSAPFMQFGVKSVNGVGSSVSNNTALVPATTSTAKLLRLTTTVPTAPALLLLNNGVNTTNITVISNLIGQQGTYRLSATASALANSYDWELPVGVTRMTDLDGLTIDASTTSIDPFIYVKFTDNVSSSLMQFGVKAVNGVGNSVTNNSALAPPTTSTAKLLRLITTVPIAPATLTLNNGVDTIAITVISKFVGQQGAYRLSAAVSTLANSYIWELPIGVTRVTALDGQTINASTTSIDPFIYVKFTENVSAPFMQFGVKAENGVGISITYNSALSPSTTSTAKLLRLTTTVPAAPTTLMLTDAALPNIKSITVVSSYIGKPTILKLTASVSVLANTYLWDLAIGVTRTDINGESVDGLTSNDPFIYVNFSEVEVLDTTPISLVFGVKAVNGVGSSLTANASPNTSNTSKLVTVNAGLPTAVATVSGSVSVCNRSEGYDYTITPPVGANYYLITAPVGSIVTSSSSPSNASNVLTTSDLIFNIVYLGTSAFLSTDRSLTIKSGNAFGLSTSTKIIALTKVSCPLPIQKIDSNGNEFKVVAYPNPYTSNFKLDFTTTSENDVEVKVFDMLGKLLDVRQFANDEMNNQDIGSDYPSGIYNVIVTQGENVQSLRVIKR